MSASWLLPIRMKENKLETIKVSIHLLKVTDCSIFWTLSDQLDYFSNFKHWWNTHGTLIIYRTYHSLLGLLNNIINMSIPVILPILNEVPACPHTWDPRLWPTHQTLEALAPPFSTRLRATLPICLPTTLVLDAAWGYHSSKAPLNQPTIITL